MPRTLTAGALLLAAMALSGCIAPRSYVDTSFPPVSYESIRRPAEPLRVTVVTEFQRQGAPFPRVGPTLRDTVARVLRGTQAFVPSDNGPDGEIRVMVNNVADLAAARAQGFGTGLTLGAVGTTVTDNYEMTVTLNTSGTTRSRSSVRHALHTAIGNTSTPAGAETLTAAVAFQRVVEQMLLSVVRDMQQAGELDPPAPAISARPPAGAPAS
jgi:hypothetical protein